MSKTLVITYSYTGNGPQTGPAPGGPARLGPGRGARAPSACRRLGHAALCAGLAVAAAAAGSLRRTADQGVRRGGTRRSGLGGPRRGADAQLRLRLRRRASGRGPDLVGRLGDDAAGSRRDLPDRPADTLAGCGIHRARGRGWQLRRTAAGVRRRLASTPPCRACASGGDLFAARLKPMTRRLHCVLLRSICQDPT